MPQEHKEVHEVLQLDKFDGTDFKYDKIIFKFQAKNTKSDNFGPKFLVPRFLKLHQTLQQDKFEKDDFKYGNSFFKLLAKAPK